MSDSGLNTENLAAGLRRVIARLDSQAEEINALDAKLGDGDLGVTMREGGRQVLEILPGLTPSVGQVLMSVARAFTKVSGSSFGTLLASALMSVAKQAGNRTLVPWGEVPGLLRTAADSIAARGKASPGDKTVLDVVDAAAIATAGLQEASAIRKAALAATRSTMERMRDQPAKLGRARIFADRSRGLDDPGMTVFLIMLESLESSATGMEPVT